MALPDYRSGKGYLNFLLLRNTVVTLNCIKDIFALVAD